MSTERLRWFKVFPSKVSSIKNVMDPFCLFFVKTFYSSKDPRFYHPLLRKFLCFVMKLLHELEACLNTYSWSNWTNWFSINGFKFDLDIMIVIKLLRYQNMKKIIQKNEFRLAFISSFMITLFVALL